MAFTIADAFDLLFTYDPAAYAAEGALGIAYEERRWFRKPRPYGLTETETQLWDMHHEQAEDVVLRKVLEAIPEWRTRLTREPFASGGGRNLGPTFPKLDAARHLPPRSPYDVFAIAAYLIDNSGLYHHIQPEKAASPLAHCATPPEQHIHDSPRHLAIGEPERRLVARAAQAWRDLPRNLIFGEGKGGALAEHITRPEIWRDLEPLFESWAVVFAAQAKAEVFVRLRSTHPNGEPAPLWWRHVWRLFAIADEAARGTAFVFDLATLQSSGRREGEGLEWFETELYLEQANRLKRRVEEFGGPARSEQPFDVETLSVARADVLGVLPKVRTPSVGCTLRSLSHHLALTPGQGIARGRWTSNFGRAPASGDAMPDGQMNILLIPFPFVVGANAFCGAVVEKVEAPEDGGPAPKPKYGYFDVHQHWLDAAAGWEAGGRDIAAELVDFLRAMIAATHRHVREVHAVVFPELALDHKTWDRIRHCLEHDELEVELLIAGVSEKTAEGAAPARGGDFPPGEREPSPRHGNFVAVTSFKRGRTGTDTERRRTSVREKHHRWKLDRDQLRDYGLLGVLSPEMQWWENIALQSRRIDFQVIRQRSVLSAMICEDLARVDPCQQLIRAVAPNLVVALLMDAPQKAARWPGRYATVLAEDPGAAVLTVTSRGLMARQDRLGIFPSDGADRTVAMWRDDRSGRPMELNCPYDAQGVLLTVVEEASEDISLDGRRDRSAIAFRYGGHLPIRLPAEVKGLYGHILGGEDSAC